MQYAGVSHLRGLPDETRSLFINYLPPPPRSISAAAVDATELRFYVMLDMLPETVPSLAAGCHAPLPYAFSKECIRQVGCDKSAGCKRGVCRAALAQPQPAESNQRCLQSKMCNYCEAKVKVFSSAGGWQNNSSSVEILLQATMGPAD